MSYPVYNVKGVSTVFIEGRRLMLPHSSCMSIDDGEAVRLLNSAQKGANGSVLSAPRYLIFNYGIFSEKTTNRLSELVSWLVPGVKRVRWTITFIIVFVLMLQTVTYWVSSYSATNATVLLLVPALMIWHELGHAAAMTRFGMRSDGIGIGIYFLFPSLYTRLSLLRIASIEESGDGLFGWHILSGNRANRHAGVNSILPKRLANTTCRYQSVAHCA